ncbi:hypothetical protein E1265_00085 [Streptomyces sp. 8K308]|uniref:hypothetical protein n=1 Tax=Streptomyces sp. 8K308 TaxID=2530388 RepID=UPI001048FF2E|nr:hypothetical protein [Streptomyces sp. 8K308]TDC27982.1 hypothetical protein E1265_00085 [Streptomyces sp. 8K308]
MTMTSRHEETIDQLAGTSGMPTANFVPEALSRSSKDTGKVVRSGIPTSTFWHFADFRWSGEFLHTETLPTSQVNAFSQVAVSICELNADGVPFIGNARLQVYNVAPHGDGRIIVRGNVEWDKDLNVRLNYIIVN